MSASISARSRPMRVLRAAVFSAGGALLGIGAHRLGGGAVPPGWVTVAVLITLFALAYAFTGRRRRTPAVTALVIGTQTLVHCGLSAVAVGGMTGMSAAGRSTVAMALCFRAGHPPTAAELSSAHRALHELGVTVPSGSGGPTGASMQSMHMGPAMLAAHLVTALLLGWWLARGERLAWTCAQRVVTTIRTAMNGFTVPATTGTTVPARSGGRARHRWCRLSAPGRAPPQLRLPALRALAA